MADLPDVELAALLAATEGDAAAAASRLAAAADALDAAAGQRLVAGLLQARRLPQAQQTADRLLRRWPATAALHALRGHTLRLLGEAGEAEAALRRALELDAAHAEAALSLAFLLREQGRLGAAADVMRRLWDAQPATSELALRCIAFTRECQREEVAAQIAAAALAQWPDEVRLLAQAGELALERGDFETARAQLSAAASRDPARGATWLRLAHSHRYRRDEPGDAADIAALRAARASQRGEDAQTCLCFALGKVLDDRGERAEAVALWREGNARARRQQTWSSAGWERFVAQQMAAPPLPAIDAAADWRPLFVVGLPRTGTTLVASLLARDAAVRSRGELNWLAALAARLGPRPDRAALGAAAALFAAQLRQDDAPARIYLDKNPLNFRHLGLALALFPQAQVVHCVRDLRDSGLSIWSQHFAHPDLAWSYDFGDIAAYAAGERALMAHWRRRFPAAIHALRYEDLVQDSDAALASLREFLGLPPSAGDAAAPAGAIRTASVWQARQAVHARSVGRWRDYVALLPQLAALSGA